uniref:Uncharacterized protein n=1 Tax=Panagrolaimus superbus TaxID=310955 RepID=A0A914Y8Z9_9BILA
MFKLYIFLFLLNFTVFCCNIETLLQGTFNRQISQYSNFSLNSVTFEKVVISSISANIWGDCYEKVETHSFIFGLKRIGKGTCFRCITLIPRSTNVIQSLHQNSETCHETVMEAKRSCFDSSAIGPGDGDLLFRIENIQYQSCGLEGSLFVEYSRINEMNLKCAIDSGTEMQNCDSKEELHFRFRNCSFPEFDQKLTCLGSWAAAGSARNENFLVLFDQDTRQYRCGKLSVIKNESQLIVAGDASCSKLESNNAFEKYRFITSKRLRGESLGYHCLWFKSRSNSVIEFKTTIIATEGNTVCRKEEEFAKAVWTTLISKTPKKSACAFFGSYSTPKEMQINDCYNLTVNCKKRNKFKIVAYHCQSGIAYDVKSYDCYGTWKEDENLFVYAKTQDSQNENVCMISRQQGDYLYLAILGNHCSRNFNFSENPDSVLVLKRTGKFSL